MRKYYFKPLFLLLYKLWHGICLGINDGSLREILRCAYSKGKNKKTIAGMALATAVTGDACHSPEGKHSGSPCANGFLPLSLFVHLRLS
jgi:hypothetical protein